MPGVDTEPKFEIIPPKKDPSVEEIEKDARAKVEELFSKMDLEEQDKMIEELKNMRKQQKEQELQRKIKTLPKELKTQSEDVRNTAQKVVDDLEGKKAA